jgi:hypothetical protein
LGHNAACPEGHGLIEVNDDSEAGAGGVQDKSGTARTAEE